MKPITSSTMKYYTLFLCFFLTCQAYGQNDEKKNVLTIKESSYEDKIAEKTCLYLAQMDSIPDPKQAIIKCTIKAINKVHEEDVEKKYKRDYTVEGIRGLQRKVFDLLIENCSIVSIDED